MRSRISVFAALFGLALGAQTAGAQAHFTAKLTGEAEVPAVATPAKGTACLTVTPAGLQYFITTEGLSGPITAAHFHGGQAGVGGGVVFNIGSDFNTSISPNSAQGIWTPAAGFTTARLAELMAGGLYLNVHTAANPAGEIRGQIFQSAGVHFSASITGQEENPPVAPAGTGTGSFILSEEGLAYDITVTNLTGAITAAHIHKGRIGENGGVLQNLNFSGNRLVGFIARTAFTNVDLEALIGGGTYVNVHTAANPGGESRGQIKLNEGWGFTAGLNGAQEVPPTAAGELGTSGLTLTATGLRYDITVSGLSGGIIAAHIHNAATGSNGPVVHDLLPAFGGGNTAAGVWQFSEGLSANLVNELLQGRCYINVHTAANPAGEIRGQITPQGPGQTYVATFSAAAEEPPVAAAGTGTGTAVLSGGNLVVRVTVNNLTGGITAAHIHTQDIGSSGGVSFNLGGLFVGNTGQGTWAIPAASIADLYNGRLYFNVHTAANPAGEVRGQILPASGTALDAQLTASQEVPSNGTPGLGTATCRLTPDGMAFHLTVDNLTGGITAAHIHNGTLGVSGGVARDILPDFVGRTARGVWRPTDPAALTDALITTLMRQGHYFNIHTAANPAGEIRGQIKMAGGGGYGTMLLGGNEVGPTPAKGTGVLSATLTDLGLVFRTSVTDLTGARTAAHFHNAPAGSNGGVVRDLAGDFTNNTADGVWRNTDASAFTLTRAGQVVLGEIYENVHTAAFPSGEIRGQIGTRTPSDVTPGTRASGLVLRNTPNPFVRSTQVAFYLPQAGRVSLRVFDANGRQVRSLVEGQAEAGWHEATFESGALPNGMYLYRLESNGGVETRKMMHLK
ncbi:MAG: CHRD domain-containing protein [Candidatus Eisenbacteria bacterium]|nr:CHRD domain-containing protein [Candidatus Eisenbacteria bacterium]